MSPPVVPQSPEPNDEHVLQHLTHAIKSIRYGSVELVIQDGKVVQVETREKRRFDLSANRK